MISVRHIEMHVTHTCNLQCDNCGHFSNLGLTGHLSLEAAERDMRPWGARLSPGVFDLMGGEPTLHPRLPEFLRLARRYWPLARLRLITNGWFLARHGDGLAQALSETNAHVEVSVHHQGETYQRKMQEVRALLDAWWTTHRVCSTWRDSFARWQRMYRGYGKQMEPYADGQPATSWSNCLSKWCLNLFEGRLYKCPPVAYLPMLDRRHGLLPSWDPYLKYRPLEPDCSDDELRAFVARRVEAVCGMCPAHPERVALKSPIPGISE